MARKPNSKTKFSWATIRNYISPEEPATSEASNEAGNVLPPIIAPPKPHSLITWNNSLRLQKENSGPLSGASATDADFARRFRDGTITGCIDETISEIQEQIRNRPTSYDSRDVDTSYISYEGSETKCFGRGRTYHPDYCFPSWTPFHAGICTSCSLYQPFDTYWTYAGTFDADTTFVRTMPCKLAPVTQLTANPKTGETELLTCNGNGFDHRGFHLGACQNVIRTLEKIPEWWDESAVYDTTLTKLACNPENKRFVYKVNVYDTCTHCRRAGKNYLVKRFEDGLGIVRRVLKKNARPYSRRTSRILRHLARYSFDECCEESNCPFKVVPGGDAAVVSAAADYEPCGPGCMYDEDYNPFHVDCPFDPEETIDCYGTAKPTPASLEFDYALPDYEPELAHSVAEYHYAFEGEIYETRTVEKVVAPAVKKTSSKPWTPAKHVTEFLKHFTFGKASNSAAGHKGAHGTFKCEGCKRYVGQNVTCFWENDAFCRTCAGDFATEFLELKLDMPTFEELKENQVKQHTMVTTEIHIPAKTVPQLQYRYRIVTVTNTIPDLIEHRSYPRPIAGFVSPIFDSDKSEFCFEEVSSPTPVHHASDVYDKAYAAQRFTEAYINHTAKHEDSIARRFLTAAVPLLLEFRARPPPSPENAHACDAFLGYRSTSGHYRVHWTLRSQDGRVEHTPEGDFKIVKPWNTKRLFVVVKLMKPKSVCLDMAKPRPQGSREYGICGDTVRLRLPESGRHQVVILDFVRQFGALPVLPKHLEFRTIDDFSVDILLSRVIPEYGRKDKGMITFEQMARLPRPPDLVPWTHFGMPHDHHSVGELAFALSRGFKPVIPAREYLWPNTPGVHSYDLEEALVVAEYEGWVMVLIKGQITLWSAEPTPHCLAPLPFASHTSPIHLRSLPFHDHRWIAKPDGDYGVIIPSNSVAPYEPTTGFTMNGHKRTRTLTPCSHQVDPIRHVFGGKICHRCVVLEGFKCAEFGLWGFIVGMDGELPVKDVLLNNVMYKGVVGMNKAAIACKVELTNIPEVYYKVVYANPTGPCSTVVSWPVDTYVRLSVAVIEIPRIEFALESTPLFCTKIPAFTRVTTAYLEGIMSVTPITSRATTFKWGGPLDICWSASTPYYDTGFLNKLSRFQHYLVACSASTVLLSDHIDHGEPVYVMRNPRSIPCTRQEQLDHYAQLRNTATLLDRIPFALIRNGQPIVNARPELKGTDPVWRNRDMKAPTIHRVRIGGFPDARGPVPEWMHRAIEAINQIPGDNVLITAGCQRPPVPGWNCVNLGEAAPGWINVPIPITGRRLASARLIALFSQKKYVWIVNGRTPDSEIYHFEKSKLAPGWNTAPSPFVFVYGINLRSSIFVRDSPLPFDLFDFAGSFKFSGIYGHDEYFVTRYFKTSLVHGLQRQGDMIKGATVAFTSPTIPPSALALTGAIKRDPVPIPRGKDLHSISPTVRKEPTEMTYREHVALETILSAIPNYPPGTKIDVYAMAADKIQRHLLHPDGVNIIFYDGPVPKLRHSGPLHLISIDPFPGRFAACARLLPWLHRPGPQYFIRSSRPTIWSLLAECYIDQAAEHAPDVLICPWGAEGPYMDGMALTTPTTYDIPKYYSFICKYGHEYGPDEVIDELFPNFTSYVGHIRGARQYCGSEWPHAKEFVARCTRKDPLSLTPRHPILTPEQVARTVLLPDGTHDHYEALGIPTAADRKRNLASLRPPAGRTLNYHTDIFHVDRDTMQKELRAAELAWKDAQIASPKKPIRDTVTNFFSNLVKASDISRTKPSILSNSMGRDWAQAPALQSISATVASPAPKSINQDRHSVHLAYLSNPNNSTFKTLVDVANSSIQSFPMMNHIGVGWVYNQGLAYFEPDYAYKNNEWSIFRRKNVKTLHFLDIPTPPKMPLPDYIEELVIWVERYAQKFNGKVVITANPDGPPPPASLGFAPLSINGSQEGWITRQVPQLVGRENAFARLVVMLTSDKVQDWWIVNGRGVELCVLPDLIPGRIHTWNRFDACPIVLSSARSNLKIRDEKNFAGYLALSRHYGVDEVVLQSYPCTVSMSQRPTVASFGIYPIQGGWEDIEIIHNTKVWYKGEGTRLAIYNAKFARSEKQLPAPYSSPAKLQYDQRKNLDHIERTLADVTIVDSPLDVEEPKDTLLVVAYGTRGDIVPVKYMARVAQTLGIKTVLWVMQINSEQLQRVIKGDIRGQIRNFLMYYGVGRMGFKGVLTPQLRVPGNSRTFELTPWEFTEPIKNDYWISQTLLNLFVSVKTPDIKIGSVIGSNFPRSSDGNRSLRMTHQDPARPEKIGYVVGSDGLQAVPDWIQKAYQRIDNPDHAGSAFDGFTKVWCTGGQGIMQTLRMKDVIPLVYAPGFDRTLNLPHDQRYLQETDFSHFVRVLEDMGFRLGDHVTKSWRTSLKHSIPHVKQASVMLIVRLIVLVILNRQWFTGLLTTAVSFPELALIARTGLVDAGLLILAFFIRYPLATSLPGFVFTCCYLAVGEVLILYSKWQLAGEKHVFLGVQTSRKFPFVEHMALIDQKIGERVHLQWQGDRRNLVNPFRGVIDNHVQPVENVFLIPVPINYPRARAALLHRTGRYSPWFNCQTVLPAVTDYNFFVTAIVVSAQVIIFPLTFIAYISWVCRWFSSVEIASLPPDDFFRFGREHDYDALKATQRTIAEQEEIRKAIVEESKVTSVEGSNSPCIDVPTLYKPGVSLDPVNFVPLSSLHPTVRAVVTITEEEDEEDYLPKHTNAIEWNPAFDENATADTLLNEAIEELKAHPDAYTLDDFVLHAALLAESAKVQGMPDEHAYHGAIIALHDYILSMPEPDEVDEWRREFVPLRAARGLNRALQTLSNWIHASHSALPKGIRSFLSALYRWIEGLAAKLKTYGIKIYRAAQYVGDQIARISIVLWREFSKALLPLFDIMFGGKLAKRMKAVWALGGVAKNPSMSAQRRLQEMYAMASYERDPHFETAYKQAIEDVLAHLPPETAIGPNLYPSYVKPLKGKRPLIEAGHREDFIKWLYPQNDKLGRSQYRAATVPLKAVMSRFEADAIVEGKIWTGAEIDRLNALRKTDYPAFARELTDKYNASGRAVSLDDERVAQLYHDIYLSEQVLQRLSDGAPQTVDHVWEVAQNPSVMYEMQERYAYYGLKFDPASEIIPPVLPPERMALYDEVAAKIVAKWPERYQNRQVTSPETLMNYLSLKKQWTRGSGPMFEPSYADRRQLTQLRKDGHAHIDGTDQMDIGKRFKMWESGLGYAVLKKAYADARSGKVDVQQFAAFVKSQPTPVNKLARGVTFMPITQWFKGMMECFAQNQRVTWRSTYIGKNMPLGQHMREFFDKVRVMPVVGEGDAKQMDSRFQSGILYGLGRIAHHAWTWGSPHVANGAAIASHKAKRYEALQDGWIFNLHIPAKGYKAPSMLAPAGLNPRYTPSVWVTFKGENRYFSSRSPQTMEIVKKAIDSSSKAFEDWFPIAAKELPEEKLEALCSSIHRHRMLESTHPQYANVTKKIRGGATGLEDTTDLNTDGKKLGTIAALVTYGELIGRRISVAAALDESKYIEAHTSDDNIFGIDPMRLYGITEEEFKKTRPQFIQAFAENNLDMTFFFREGEHNGVRGRFLEYLSHFSRPITNRDRLTIQRVNDFYRHTMKDENWPGIKDPLSGEDPTAIVYINTGAMDSRQSANNAYKASKYNDRYLFAMIARDVGQANLKAFNFKSYTQNLSAYHTNAMRYLAAAAFPKTCVRNGIASLPEFESDEWNFIQAHFHPTEESVGKSATYQRYRIDGNVLTRKWPKGIHGEGVPIAFYERLEKLKKEAQFPAYTTIVYNHMKPQKDTKINKTARTWAKVTRGVLSPDEGIKQTLDEMREFFQAIPKKFTRGVVPTLEMVHPDEIWQGSGRVEASIFKKYEQDCIAAGTTTNLGGFSRLINRSPYGGCCDAAYWYHHFHTDEGNAMLAQHPDYVWRNACTMISVVYGFSWFVERFILGLAWIGMFWAVMMFYLIDISKIYSVLGLIRWHSTMDADPYIAGLLPRDVYIHSKRFSDWAAGFVPMGFFYFLRFDILIDGPSEWCSHVAKMVQTFTYTTPMTSTQPGQPQNEWGPIAATLVRELTLLRNAGRAAVVSVKGPTGTGKSTWLVYEIMRLWLLERGGRTFLVAPFTVLRDDWSLPSWFGFGNHDTPEAERNSLYQVLKGGVTIASNKKVLLATYGHFAGRIERGEIRENDIVCMDESHLGGPAQVLVQRLCEERGIAIINLSATPARVEGLNQGEVIDATNVVTQKNRKKVELFPAGTSQITMLQEMFAKKEVDPLLGYSHRDMAMRCIIKANKISGKGDNVISHIIAGIDELRRADPEIPMAFEFSSATFKTQKKEREEYCNKGRYIIVATDIIGVGYDIKPPAYSIIDNGLTIQEHQGFLQQPMNSTKDQMEQFHGRVGRNSSDRNGLIYCTENAGTGTPAQGYGSGSYYVDDRICKAIGVPRLKEVPAGAAVPSFPYFGISPTILDPQLRAGLVWTFLMALSGVAPHEMPTFYRRYAEQGWKLPEEQEWLAKQIESARVSQQVPSWRVIDTLHMQDPFFVFVENMAVLGGSTAPKEGFQLERGGQFCGPIYPRAGQWMTYSHLSKNKNTITVKAHITTESQAFEEITKEYETRIEKLEARLKKRNSRLTDGSRLKDELELRQLQTQTIATKAGHAASTLLDSLKPQIVSAVTSQALSHAHDSIWSAGLEEARKRADIPVTVSHVPPPFNPTAAVRNTIVDVLNAEEQKRRPPVDKPAAHRMIKAAIDTNNAQQSRKVKRAELNIAYSRFRLQAKAMSIPDELIQIAWNTSRNEILENTATNMHVYDITPNKKLTDCLIRWTYWRGANRRSLQCQGDEHDRDEIEQVCKEAIEGEVAPVDSVCLICRTCYDS